MKTWGLTEGQREMHVSGELNCCLGLWEERVTLFQGGMFVASGHSLQLWEMVVSDLNNKIAT